MASEVGLKWHLARWVVLELGLEGVVQNLLWQEIVLLHISNAIGSLPGSGGFFLSEITSAK